MDPNPPEIVVLSNPAAEPRVLNEENQTLKNSHCSLPLPNSGKQRKAPSVFISKGHTVGAVSERFDYCLDGDYNATGLPAVERDNISDNDGNKSDWSDDSSISGTSSLSGVSKASATKSRAFKKLVATIGFLKKWAARTETIDTKNEFLKKFKMSEPTPQKEVVEKQKGEKDHQVIVRIRRRLWKKTAFFNPAGNVLYWYKQAVS